MDGLPFGGSMSQSSAVFRVSLQLEMDVEFEMAIQIKSCLFGRIENHSGRIAIQELGLISVISRTHASQPVLFLVNIRCH
jgi:hypothetical protein